MKITKLTLLVAMLAISSLCFGQKVEKLFYEGYIKNEPKEYLPEINYTMKYGVDDWFKAQIEENSLNLELKGFNEGNGYSVILLSDKPTLTGKVLKEKQLGSDVYSYKAHVKAKSNHKIMILDEKNQLVYEFKVKPKLFHSETSGLGTKATEGEANAQVNEIKKKRGSYLKKSYVKELISSYQAALDNKFGKYQKKVDYKIYKIKPKKFNYDEVNAAAEKFKAATSTETLNKEDIKAAIAVWEKNITEYQPGKKTRICDRNIDPLYLNLAQAYLALEDDVNTKKYWDMCVAKKGNKGAELKVEEFLKVRFDNMENYPKSKENFAPKSIYDKVKTQNQNLFFNLILAIQLAETQGEMMVIQDYFPLNISTIREVDALHYIDQDIQEKIKIKYNLKGNPVSAEYNFIETNEEGKNFKFTFSYKDDKIVSANLNGNLKYKIDYTDDVITKVIYNPTKPKRNIYKFDYSNPDKIMLTMQLIENGETKDSPYTYHVSFNEKGLIKKYFIYRYSAQEHVYDEKGNLIGMSNVNGSTGIKHTSTFISEFDDHGQVIKRKFNEESDYYIQRKYKYWY